MYSGDGGAYVIFATAINGMYKAQLSGKTLNEQPHYAQKDVEGAEDVFIVRVNSNGEKLYATYFGGSGEYKRKKFAILSQSEMCKWMSTIAC